MKIELKTKPTKYKHQIVRNIEDVLRLSLSSMCHDVNKMTTLTIGEIKMQYEKDLKSKHKDLFLQARTLPLSLEGIIETKKERITSYSDDC